MLRMQKNGMLNAQFSRVELKRRARGDGREGGKESRCGGGGKI